MFEEKYNEILMPFQNGAVFVLATAINNRPASRSISGFSMDGKIYFQTDKEMEKAIHISQNPYVSICLNEIQIQGICTEKGHPMTNSNATFLLKFKEYFPRAFEKYSHVQTEVVFEVTPQFIKIWKSVDGIPCLETVDVVHKICDQKLFKEY